MIAPHTHSWWRATLALCLGSFLVFINLYAPQPLLPALRETYEVSTLGISLVMSVATLALAGSLLVFGPLSDAIGRDAIMRLTLLAAGLLSLGLAFAPNFETLLVMRALQGFMLGGLPAVAIAWMGDEFERPALLSAVGLYIGANSLGGISGRVVGGTVAEIGGAPGSFLAVGTMTLVGLVLFWKLLPAARAFTPRRFELGVALADLGGHLRNPLLLGAYLLGGLNFLIFINQYSYITFRLAEAPFGLGTRVLGLIFLTYLGGTLGSSLSGRLAGRWSQPVCMMLGILILIGGTAVTLAESLGWIIVGLTLNAFGFFLAHSMASSWVGRRARSARGSASALYLVFYYTGASLGGFWLEPFWQTAGWNGVALASWLMLAVTLGLAAWLLRRERREHQEAEVALASSPQTSSSRSTRPQADL
ncbi:MFS transporter [Halomonas daqiaonensis]|uniref:MFS transporter, YNFM family, putative membrane transport protein n=1 Tax=Halomonas daqiaonensis TaxID=650850 RepID=A0A1H7L4C0_9GAMM|nr:MFS transporter [Halomonas daqiaonensis]SEK93808.1 MFS transporter, YNFM family, putative membrane transport protein [Halomonas daqiaonensis]